MNLTVRVPATVANLGPGFDCFGLALCLSNEVTVQTDTEPSVTIEGEGASELPRDGSNLVVRAMERVFAEWGHHLPPTALTCTNAIPLERGLGSSAAAIVAGLLLADRLVGTPLPPDRILELAVELEGHADNVAAALRGGVAIAYSSADGWRAERMDPAADLRPVVLLPHEERVGTEEARNVLEPRVDRADATFNTGRAALLVLALTSRPDLLRVALQDRLHQRARLDLAPGASALFTELEAAGVPVCVAGSGPTLLAFDTEEAPVPEPGPAWRAIKPGIDREGATVLAGGLIGR
ncbi:MAG: homoserine kinase [Actinomycetota bacterium]